MFGLPRELEESPSMEEFKKHGTWGHGLVAVLVSGWMLDLILEVSSK